MLLLFLGLLPSIVGVHQGNQNNLEPQQRNKLLFDAALDRDFVRCETTEFGSELSRWNRVV